MIPIPLIATLLPTILKGVVTLVDKVKGDKTGAEKKPLAVNIIQTILEAIKQPGLGLPGPAELGPIVDQTVAELNAAGKLKGFATIMNTDIDAPLLELCATFLDGQARRLREIARGQ